MCARACVFQFSAVSEYRLGHFVFGPPKGFATLHPCLQIMLIPYEVGLLNVLFKMTACMFSVKIFTVLLSMRARLVSDKHRSCSVQ